MKQKHKLLLQCKNAINFSFKNLTNKLFYNKEKRMIDLDKLNY